MPAVLLLSWTEEVPLCPPEGEDANYFDGPVEESASFYGIYCNGDGLITQM
jgi:hypothetical protein